MEMENQEGQDQQKKPGQKQTPTIPQVVPHLMARASPPIQRVTRVNWATVGLVAGIAAAIVGFSIAWQYSTPLQISAVLKGQEIPKKGEIDFSTFQKYALPYAPLRVITQTRIEGGKLTIRYERDWFAFGGMGVLCPVLFVIMFGLSGSLLQDRKIRKRGGLL